ncbi:MAG: hypothetical protein HQK84_07810 [Nitrospinae bacterium]|nr:hypothetical protein [Nitrospinota bacterium]
MYLVSQIEDSKDLEKALKKHYKEIFENELFDWYTDESKWPKKSCIMVFKEFFEVEFNEMVINLSRDDLILDEV